MKKKILLISAALLLVACGGTGGGNTSSQTPGVTPSSQPEVDDTHIEGSKGLQYTLSDDETYYILTGLGSCKDDEVIIGNWYNGKPVLEVGEAALSTNDGEWGPKIIRVSEGITTLGFRGLRSRTVEYIYLPESVTTLTKATFILDKSLKSVVIGSKVTKIEDDVFMECPVQDIYFKGTRAEWDKVEKSLNNNTTLFDAAFHYGYRDGQPIDGVVKGSEGLTYTISDDETSYAFSSLGTCVDKDIVIGNYYNNLPVTDIASMAISAQETDINSIKVSKGITNIGFAAIAAWKAKEIDMPSGITEYAKAQFIHCESIETVYIGHGLTKINEDCFFHCDTTLKDIYFRGTQVEWEAIEIAPTNNNFANVTIHYNYIG